MARREKRPGAGLMPTAIGVDIGGTNLRAARVTNRGEILERISERITRDPETVVGRIIDLVSRLDRPDVAAIGIGVPGRVDARRQEVLSAAISTSPARPSPSGSRRPSASPSPSTTTATWRSSPRSRSAPGAAATMS